MKSASSMFVVLSALAALLIIPSAVRAEVLGGGAFIPVQDGSSHECIDVTQSTVSISLVTAQLRRTDTFWKKSKSLGVKIDVRLINQSSEPFDFPRGRQVSVSTYKGDIGLLPMIFPVMAKYSLVDPNNQRAYVNLGLDVFLINLESESSLASGILKFIDFSKNLPLPPNPYLQGVQFFGAFAQKIIDGDIHSTEDKLPAATLSFDLASSGADISNCEAQRNASWRYPVLRDGIIAVMWDYEGKPEDGFVRLSEVDKYCYYPTQSQRIAFAAKSSDVCPPASQSKTLNNPLVVFEINKWVRQPSAVKPADFNIGPLHGAVSKPFLSTSSAEAVVHKERENTNSQQAAVGFQTMGAQGVKSYFDAINTGNLREQLNAAGKNAPEKSAAVREAETAIALHRCGLLGISPSDCL